MTLFEIGARALAGTVFGPAAEGETSYAGRLLHLLRPDMLVLWDKGFDSNAVLASITDTGAQVLGRVRSNRRTPVLTRLANGSYLSVIGTVNVRIVDAQIAVICADGTSFTGSYRLVTTLTDTRRCPATALVGVYYQRWEHESAYYAHRHTIMNGRNLRLGDPAGIEQEKWSLLTLYQALRTAMIGVAESLPGTDPDRCCVTHLNITSSNPWITHPHFSRPPETTGTPPPARGADIASWPCSRKNPRVFGSPVTAPPTSAMSFWRPCTDN